jgi:hypothetical protein
MSSLLEVAMRLQPFVVLAIAALAVLFGNVTEPASSRVAASPLVAPQVEAPMSLASAEEPFLGCGETRCTRDADCPSTCGGCITWSGTCALFQPR